ncbi:MAG TPA: RNA polymerase sigma factor [Caldisericia bacterium]|nr:RNA polymerase sigma factor [Caldisericia bacterium]
MKKEIKEIIEGCKRGERTAQRLLFELLAPRLLSVSRQYCPKNTDPLDNLQDSFVKLFYGIQGYDVEKGHIESWARKIVINTALSKLEKKKIEEVWLQQEELDHVVVDSINDCDDLDHLMQIIEALPDGYKQVFCLYEIEGYSHKEIAAALHIQEATSRSQLNRSKEILRQQIIKFRENPFFNIQAE